MYLVHHTLQGSRSLFLLEVFSDFTGGLLYFKSLAMSFLKGGLFHPLLFGPPLVVFISNLYLCVCSVALGPFPSSVLPTSADERLSHHCPASVSPRTSVCSLGTDWSMRDCKFFLSCVVWPSPMCFCILCSNAVITSTVYILMWVSADCPQKITE